LPKIEIGKEIQEGDEFGKLASTLNSLNARIQKQIENLVGQRNETKSILEALGEGVIAVGQDGLITFVNRAAYDMLRIERETLLNCKLSEIHAGRAFLGKKSRELLEQAFESRETLVETIVVQEKQKLHFNLIATPLEKPGVIILVLQDKTSDYLVVEMGKDFVANASHELRTPITVIRGFAETVLDMPQLTQEQLREIFEKIVKTSVRLDSLVQSLLSLADLEHMDEERFTKVDLVKVCENCVQLFSAAHPQANLQLHKHVSQAIARAEGDLLEMAVMNLLQNAVKYSPAKAKVDLTIQKQKDFYEIVVTDQGIGIPEQDLPHLFDRFYTVDKARSRKFGGTGLGLSIAKTIVDKHHGTIRVVSHVGQGSSFTISLLGLND
jgi:signal transduction histidine kinase